MNKGLRISATIWLDEKHITLLCLIVMGFSHAEMAQFTGYALDTVKKDCRHLFYLFGVHNCRRLCYKALLCGFDIYGRYRGENMLHDYEREKLRKSFKWVHADLPA